jgi:hypothetical protein
LNAMKNEKSSHSLSFWCKLLWSCLNSLWINIFASSIFLRFPKFMIICMI